MGGESLCVSEPRGRRAEPPQAATGKPRRARVGGCEAGAKEASDDAGPEGQSRGEGGGTREGAGAGSGELPAGLLQPSLGL